MQNVLININAHGCSSLNTRAKYLKKECCFFLSIDYIKIKRQFHLSVVTLTIQSIYKTALKTNLLAMGDLPLCLYLSTMF